MPPKKNTAKSSNKNSASNSSSERTKQLETRSSRPDEKQQRKNGTESQKPKSNTSKKRKSSPSTVETLDPKTKPAKVPKQSSRASNRTSNLDSTAGASPSKKCLNFLLSPASLPYCFPSDELSAAEDDKNITKTYSRSNPASFSPFEQLLIASLLSKPLNHKLGLRSIRTLLNEPFAFTSAGRTAQAGENKIWEALEVARTQHRQKTAGYVFKMAQMCAEEGGWGDEFDHLREMDADSVQAELKNRIKGMGPTGADLFLRRIQCRANWEGSWPFADEKALKAVVDCGIDVKDASGLRELMEAEVDWDEMGFFGLDSLDDSVEGSQKKRIAFVLVLERALGASLEGKPKDLKNEAMRS